MSGALLRGRRKARRATVVWYDGDIVKRGMNIAYVPRNPRGRAGRDYQRLCDEAGPMRCG